MTNLLALPIEEVKKVSPFKNVYGNEDGVRMNENGSFIFPKSENVTYEVVKDFIKLHSEYRLPKLLESHYMYLGEYPITYNGTATKIPDGLPDNRVVVNFAKYIVDTFNGYFIGIPVKITSDDENVNEKVNEFYNSSDLADNLAELSKLCSIYGTAFAYLYTDENGEVKMTYNSPLDMLLIHSDTIDESPLFAIRYHYDKDNYLKGTLYYGSKEYAINGENETLEELEKFETFDGLPVIEFVENDFRQSSFEQVKNMMNHFNKVLSSKANDVEYFANAFLKIVGASVENGTIRAMQENRVINVTGNGSQNVDIDFIGKPDGDTTQENLLERLSELIFTTAMVANTTSENFGNVSGVALEFKLQNMHNLAIAKERKFTSGLKQMFKIWATVPIGLVHLDDYKKLQFDFTRNIPKNIQEEINNAKNLTGIVSKETQLKQLSFIDNPVEELEQLEKEQMQDYERYSTIENVSPDNVTGESILNDNNAQGL